MALREDLEISGGWLFRYRSFVPFAFIPVLGAALAALSAQRALPLSDAWEVSCCAVAWLGCALRATVVGFAPPGTSGRNTDGQRAAHLNTRDMYSVVRHPLYVGNFLIGLGAVLFFQQAWAVALYGLAFWLYYERIMLSEEEFLRSSFGSAFEAWARVTPAFIPRPGLWRPSGRSFCWRSILRRECSTWLLVALMFPLLELAEHWVLEGRWHVEAWHAWMAGGGALVFVCLVTLKRCTLWLHSRERLAPLTALSDPQCGVKFKSDRWLARHRRALSLSILIPCGLMSLFEPCLYPEGVWGDLAIDALAWTMFACGAGLRLWATLYIGGHKNARLETAGPYAHCRNPLYLGSALMLLSLAVCAQSLTLALGSLGVLWFFFRVVVPAEERSLRQRFGGEYDAYAERTPRLCPRLFSPTPNGEITVSLTAVRSELGNAVLWVWLPILGECLSHLRIAMTATGL